MLNDKDTHVSKLSSKEASYFIGKDKMAVVLSALASGNRINLTEALEPRPCKTKRPSSLRTQQNHCAYFAPFHANTG